MLQKAAWFMLDQEHPSTILVVDDNEATRYIISRSLKGAGYRVLEASCGEEALRMVQSKPDLVTLDIQLPDLNGVEICRRIKSHEDTAGIPVLHMSANFTQGRDHAHALENGADGYLNHPIEEIVLIATVKAFLRARKAEREREQLLVQSKRDVEQLQIERDLREKFVATLTHDLRNPLTAAKMGAQLILRQTTASEAIQRQAHRIKENIDRADQMIQDLLDANRVRAGKKLPLKLEDCNLKAVVENTLADLTTVHGDRFIVSSDNEVAGVWDPRALRRLIENLVNNAVKYGDSYRPITLELKQDPAQVRLSVHNDGNPLSREDKERVFKPYQRGATAEASLQKGWGLGLVLVHGVAAAHGGHVTVDSDATSGTKFTLVLPRDSTAFLEKITH
jgi:signal transduction histidine kinase